MEHRRDRQHCIVLADAERIHQTFGKGVQHDGPVGIDHTFRIARRAGCETHRRAFVLVQIGIDEIVARFREQLFVIEKAVRHAAAAVRGDDHALEVRYLAKLLINREKNVINDQEAIPRVICDGGDFVRVQAEVQSVQYAARARDPEERFEMTGMIPHHRSDAVAPPESELCERRSEPARAAVELAVAGADDRAVRLARYNLHAGEKLSGALEHRGERERKIHHCAAHGILAGERNCTHPITKYISGPFAGSRNFFLVANSFIFGDHAGDC